MKINTYFAVGLMSCMLSLASCSDFLDVKSTDTQTTTSFYQTEGQIEQALTGIYNGLLPMSNYIMNMSEFRSDNVWVELNPNGQRDYSDIGGFKLSINNETVQKTWVDLYALIARANTFLEKIDPVSFGDAAIKDQYKREAYFLRGWAYFELVRYFGRVPIVTRTVSPSEANTIGQSETKAVYEQVITDLKEAQALPLENKNYLGKTVVGRANQIAAKALLGRVYLTMAGFPLNDGSHLEEAKTLFKEVIDYAESTGKYWAKDREEWQKIWVSDNDNKYHIFEIQYEKGGTGLGNPMVFYSCPQLSTNYTTVRIFGNSVWCESTLNEEFKKEYNGEWDGRCLATIDTSKFVNDEGVKYTNDDFFIKFLEHKMKRADLGYSDIDNTINGYGDWPINFPIIRLEDVMLMYAEIVGNTDEGRRMVNKIRTRAGADEIPAGCTETEFQGYVERERRLELTFEGIRWHDLVRHNNLQAIRDMFTRYGKTEYVANVKDGMYLYPIPESEMLVKPGLYQQNEAYR